MLATTGEFGFTTNKILAMRFPSCGDSEVETIAEMQVVCAKFTASEIALDDPAGAG